MNLADPQETRALNWATVGGGAGVAILLVPAVREVFLAEGLRWLHILLFSFTACLALTPLMFWLGLRWGLVDQPGERKIHLQATPRIGGLAVYLGFLGSILVNSILADWMVAVLIAGSLLLAVGIVDDISELPAWARLAAQLVAAWIVIGSGKALTLFPSSPIGQAANVVLTLVWIIGITNAFNFFDGMDGLATGLAMLMAFFMGLVAFDTNQPGLGWLTVAIIGATLGFFPFNFRLKRPAVIFLGDVVRPFWCSPWPVWLSRAIGQTTIQSCHSATPS